MEDMVEPAPDELMEILDEWGRAAMDVLIEPRISPADLMAAKNEARAKIEALYAAERQEGRVFGLKVALNLLQYQNHELMLKEELAEAEQDLAEARTRYYQGDGNE